MIHLLTAHHRDTRWIDVQLRFVARHLREPYRTYASLEGIETGWNDRFDLVVPSLGRHAGKLNHLARIATAGAHRDDLLVFLDGDAFPIADPMPIVTEALRSHALVAVRRDENLGDVQPHPCFCATTVGTWTDLGGDWSNGWSWTNELGEQQSDVGGNLAWQLQHASLDWFPLVRTSGQDLHPLWFGVYGGIVYHHGAGFRRMLSRLDHDALNIDPAARHVRRAAQQVRLRAHERRITRVSERLFTELSSDPDFHRQLL